MSQCCDEYGECTQGRDCPARTGTVLPHQAAHAARVARIKAARPRTCDDLGIFQGQGDCACTHPVPPEAGNFQIVDLGPDDDDGQPLTHDENMGLLRMLLSVVVVVAALVLLASFGTEKFSGVLWALLQGVS